MEPFTKVSTNYQKDLERTVKPSVMGDFHQAHSNQVEVQDEFQTDEGRGENQQTTPAGLPLRDSGWNVQAEIWAIPERDTQNNGSVRMAGQGT